MGCFPDKPKKEAKDNLRSTSAKQNLAIHSTKGLPVKANTGNSYEKEGQGAQQNNQSQSITQTGPVSHNYSSEKKAIQQLVKKYKIQVKQSAYKTNSIHAYSYQQLLCFNPQADLEFKTERDLFDKSHIFNLNRESALPTKFRLTNK